MLSTAELLAKTALWYTLWRFSVVLERIVVLEYAHVPWLSFWWILAVHRYTTSCVTVITSKMVITTLRAPFLLCTAQFAVSTLVAYIYLWRTNKLKDIRTYDIHNLVKIATSFSLGFLLTNMAIDVSNPSFTETVKSAEPISSVILASTMLNEYISPYKWLTVLAIAFGVALSSAEDANFSFLGLVYVLASNVMFSLRGVYTKKINDKLNTVDDSINLFYRVCLSGTFLSLTATILFDSWNLFEAGASLTWGEVLHTMQLMLINGLGFFAYNQVSFTLLSEIDFVFHANLNVFRRIFIVIVACVVYRNPITLLNVVGLVVAMAGLQMYIRLSKPLAKLEGSRGSRSENGVGRSER